MVAAVAPTCDAEKFLPKLSGAGAVADWVWVPMFRSVRLVTPPSDEDKNSVALLLSQAQAESVHTPRGPRILATTANGND